MRFKNFTESMIVFQTQRPLNLFPREKIARFINIFNLPVWSDPTNFFFCPVRSRIRSLLIPFLQHVFCPSIRRRLQQFLIATNQQTLFQDTPVHYFDGFHPISPYGFAQKFKSSKNKPPQPLKGSYSNYFIYSLIYRTRGQYSQKLSKILKCLGVQATFLDLKLISLTLLKIVK